MSIKRDAVWTALETLASQGMAFIFRLALARVLAPEAFGLIAMTMALITALQVFADFGLTAAIIQRGKQAVDGRLIARIFSMSTIISLALFVASFFLVAPIAAKFYGFSELESLIRAASIAILFAPSASIARAVMFREKKFKQYAVARTVSTIVSIVVAATVLIMTKSVWAFIVQYLLQQALSTTWTSVVAKQKPALDFNFAGIAPVLSYSSLVFLNDLIVALSQNFGTLVIGRTLSKEAVGLFALAVLITDTVRINLMTVLNRVTFVYYSEAKDDSTRLRAQYSDTVRWNCLIIFPAMTILALFAPTILTALLGSQWANMGDALRWLAVSVMIHAAGGTSSTLYKAIGRPGLDLSLFVATTLFVMVPSVLLGAHFGGIEGVAIGTAFSKLVVIIIRQVLLDRLIGQTFGRVLKVVVHVALLQLPAVGVWIVYRLALPGATWMTDAFIGGLCSIGYAALLAQQLRKSRRSPTPTAS